MKHKIDSTCKYVSLSFSKDELVKPEGIGVFMAAMFVSGELAGAGVLALPKAVAQSGQILNLTLWQLLTIE